MKYSPPRSFFSVNQRISFKGKRNAGLSRWGHRRVRAFTLFELLVVIGLIAVLSFILSPKFGAGRQSAALQTAQAMLFNLISAARTKAQATGQSSRMLIQVDPVSYGQPLRYLRYLAVQTQNPSGWTIFAEAFLPEGIYIVPGNFNALSTGVFSVELSAAWVKSDGAPLRSTALRSSQVIYEAINGYVVEQWVSIIISATAGTAQSGDLIVASGQFRNPGAYAVGESPIVLVDPASVRGLSLSAYSIPTLIDNRSSF